LIGFHHHQVGTAVQHDLFGDGPLRERRVHGHGAALQQQLLEHRADSAGLVGGIRHGHLCQHHTESLQVARARSCIHEVIAITRQGAPPLEIPVYE
jgi:hypothetical protein